MLTNFGSIHKTPCKNSTIKKKNVQVVVRTRPMSDSERSLKSKNIVACDSVSKIVSLKTTHNDKHVSVNQGQRTFGPFDKAFGSETTQIQIYNEVVAPLMKEVLNGYNCTVFAYGQTGSGKTYTMEGKHSHNNEYSWDNDPGAGIIPRALHHIFTELGKDDIDFTVRASYVELYNEQIYDLLSLSETSQFESLRIFDDKTKGVSVAGAEEVIVRTRDEVYELLKRGADKRRTAATLMNISSSRSHSVFTVSVMIRESGLVNGEELMRQGKLNLVDLAGSENIGRSGATDKRAREAGNINTSLLALGRVINALTMNAPHIPYRESKLTRILQDSLGGKTITTIIATISPASSNFEESVNALEYAQRAKNIKNNPEINQKITRRGLLKEYNDEIERLRRDLLAARDKHGIYLDKENYDNMMETIEEKSSKVEELEGQLTGQMQRVKTILEDFEIMDSHYQSVYDKCSAALNKLEKRKLEVEKLNKDLAQTKDNLKAANKALALSENSFVRLRAQAYKFQNNCTNFYQDLGVLHDKLESMKQLFADNDELLENLAIDQKDLFNEGKAKLSIFTHASTERMDKGQSSLAEIDGQTEDYLTRAIQSYTDMGKSVSNFKELATNTLAGFERESETLNSELMNASKETIKNALLLNEEMSSKLVASLDAINSLQKSCNTQREQIEKMVDEATSISKQDETELDEFISRQRASINKRRNLLFSINRIGNDLNSDITKRSDHLGSLQKEQLEKVQASNKNVMSYDTIYSNYGKNAQGASEKMHNGMDANIGALVYGCKQIIDNQNSETKNYTDIVRKIVQLLQSIVNEQKVASTSLTDELDVTLSESMKNLESFVREEFKRIQATGSTPNRRQTNSFLEDLVDLPPAQKLFEEQKQLVTPRRTSFFRGRDSILDSTEFKSALVSPNTLKSQLPGQTGVNIKLESVKEEGSSSIRSSDNSEGYKPNYAK